MLANPGCVDPFPVEVHADRLAPAPAGHQLLSLADIGFEPATLPIPSGMSGAATLFEDFLSRISAYDEARNYPAIKGPSYLSVHLRFGTLSIRHLVRTVSSMIANGAGGAGAPVWLSELIWREFYMMILYHHPHVVERSFKPAYDAIEFETGPEAEELFLAWCEGRTGYPLVDAAMAQLNQTGYMHNRLRMVTACFLIKDLGIDWRWGERYFALLARAVMRLPISVFLIRSRSRKSLMRKGSSFANMCRSWTSSPTRRFMRRGWHRGPWRIIRRRWCSMMRHARRRWSGMRW